MLNAEDNQRFTLIIDSPTAFLVQIRASKQDAEAIYSVQWCRLNSFTCVNSVEDAIY